MSGMSTQPAPQDDHDLHQYVSNEFLRALAGVSSDLRTLADAIDRVTPPAPNQDNPGFGKLAASVTSDVMNVLPNLGLSWVITAAQQADTTLLRLRVRAAEKD